MASQHQLANSQEQDNLSLTDLEGRLPRRDQNLLVNEPSKTSLLQPFDKAHARETSVDVILVPCIGGDWKTTWQSQADGSCWILQDFYDSDEVQFWAYQHRYPGVTMTLESAAKDLLSQVVAFRKTKTTGGRPIYFQCHSIGGIVTKIALNMAMESTSPTEKSVAEDCYGVTFFATPHQGSGILSAGGLKESAQAALRLLHPLPDVVAQELIPESDNLKEINERFREVAFQSLVKIWSFYEAQETELSWSVNPVNLPPTEPSQALVLRNSVSSGNQGTLKLQAKISRLHSTKLGFPHEILCGLELSHVDCPTFSNSSQARRYYVADLKKSIVNATELSRHFKPDLDILEQQVSLEIHSLYRERDSVPERDSLLRGWTAIKSLYRFLEDGVEDNEETNGLDQIPVLDRSGISRHTTTWDRTPVKILPAGTRSTYISRGLLLNRAGSQVHTDNLSLTLLRPGDDQLAVRWLHLPYTNPPWVKKILAKIYPGSPDFDFFKGDDGSSVINRGRYKSSYHGTFTSSGISYGGASALNASSSTFCKIRLPYLHFDSYKNLIRLREIIQLRLSHGRSKPVPGRIKSVGLRVVWEHMTQEPPLNCRRTLDQYGYPMIRDSRARDDDQMIYKMSRAKKESSSQPPRTKSHMKECNTEEKNQKKADNTNDILTGACADHLLDGKVLMVDSLWIFVSNNLQDIVSFFPKRESFKTDHGPPILTADLRDSVYSALNSDETSRCDTPYDLAAFIVLHAVTVLIDHSSDAELQIFAMFDEAICVLTETITTSLKSFRDGRASNIGLHGNSKIPLQHKLMHENYQAEKLNRDCTASMLDLRDCDEELQILLKLFKEQAAVVDDLIQFYGKQGEAISKNGLRYLNEAKMRLADYSNQAEDLIKRLKELDLPYNRLIDLVTRQGQWDEARWSRIQASLASRQAKALTILSIVSVIFLPLSFFTGLWGMEAREWDGDGKLSLKTIAAISLPVSFFLCLFAMVTAFKDVAYSMVAGMSIGANDTMSRLCSLWNSKITGSTKVENRGEGSEPTIARRTSNWWKSFSRTGSGNRALGLEMKTDFWDDHTPAKLGKYEIPASNIGRGRRAETMTFN